MNNTKLYIGIGILILGLVFALGRCSKNCDIKTTSSTVTTTKIDTVLLPQIVYRDSVIVKTKYKIIDRNRIDTLVKPLIANVDSLDFPVLVDSVNDLYLTPPFEFGYHTITDNTKDSIDIKYNWPSNKLTFTLQPAPREKIIEHVKETIKIELEKPLAWYHETWFEYGSRAAIAAGSFYLGLQVNEGGK